jgi:hypothetical protein
VRSPFVFINLLNTEFWVNEIRRIRQD